MKYVCLLGSYESPWMAQAKRFFSSRGITSKNNLDPVWDSINHQNGDEKQEQIDHLVAEQHQLIRDAHCVLFNLDAFNTQKQPLMAFAARCELGFLTGLGKTSFVHINPECVGRNYLRAQMKPYPYMHHCGSLRDALEQAARYFANQA